ncbi:MAG: AAA family ATPase [Planctomycetaceae bacterium]
MTLRKNQAELKHFVRRATEIIGEPSRPLNLESTMSSWLVRQARRVAVFGLDDEPSVRVFHRGLDGNAVIYGLEQFELKMDAEPVTLLRFINPFSEGCGGPLDEVWAVAERRYQRLYRLLRRATQERHQKLAPIMRVEDRQRLWDNTIGFLQRGEEALERFGVPLKRGVLLMGEPGNGKTMAARWLYTQCVRSGLTWRTVKTEQYEMARCHGEASGLFQLDEPGIILFDDFDRGMRDRDDFGSSPDHATFLSELDGVELRSGVVYLFTTNAKLKDLDPAFRRPGRIDQIIRFPRPDGGLRRRLIVELWPAELVAGIPVEEIVQTTDGLTFAEVEEIKKLLVLRYLDEQRWDWPWAWNQFQQRSDEPAAQRPMGFAINGHGNGRKRF